MSIRTQIIYGILVVQTIIIAVLAIAGSKVLRSSSEHALLDQAQSVTQLFVAAAQEPILGNDIAALESLSEQISNANDISYVRVFSNDIVVTERGDPSLLKKPFESDYELSTAFTDGVFDTSADLNIMGKRYGRVEIGFSIAEIKSVLNEAQSWIVMTVLAGALLSIGFAILFAHFITKRLNALNTAYQKVSEGKLGYTVTPSGRDELTVMMRAFNTMSETLKSIDQSRESKENEIRQLNIELENRVIERTNQLKELNRKLEQQALHDPLTRLPNRVLFHDRLNSLMRAAKRTKESFTVVAIDLNDFKEINDSLGHLAGDIALQHVAQACTKALRESDTVARMGGDEFSLLLPSCADVDNATTISKRVLQLIREPLVIDNRKLELNASIGIAIYPIHGEDESTLLHNSDIAMYEAKTKKLGAVAFGPEFTSVRNEQLALKSELRHGIEKGELLLHFQPKVDLDSHIMSGVEALVRWQHPRLGLLYPDKFIALAESDSLIKPLTMEVIRLALQQGKIWFDSGVEIPISVNISTTNLQDSEFASWVEQTLGTFKLPSHLLELEITETALMTDPLLAIETIHQLAALGVQVAIDDFGTGYSSMAYLQKLLVAKIKIDKTFVMKMGSKERDEVIVRSTIDLAHNLGLKAVAEGVENEAAWNKLKQLGCDSAQGYFMSKPIAADKILSWAEQMNWIIKKR